MKLFLKKASSGGGGDDEMRQPSNTTRAKSNSFPGLAVRPSKSILKVATQEESLSYKEIRHERFDVEEKTSDDGKIQRRAVRFSRLEVRQYKVIPETNPSVSSGPAIGLDWSYVELPVVTVDVFEAHRPPRLKIDDIPLTYMERMSLLRAAGATSSEVYAAIRRSDAAREERQETIHNLRNERSEIRRESLVRGLKKKLHIQLSDDAAQERLWKKAQTA